jgi:hypothetical protein
MLDGHPLFSMSYCSSTSKTGITSSRAVSNTAWSSAILLAKTFLVSISAILLAIDRVIAPAISVPNIITSPVAWKNLWFICGPGSAASFICYDLVKVGCISKIVGKLPTRKESVQNGRPTKKFQKVLYFIWILQDFRCEERTLMGVDVTG